MKVEILYFAWLRERIGLPREQVETSALTLRDLVEELGRRSDRHAAALSDLAAIRIAVDQTLSDLDAPLGDAREVALFPPMTGG